MTTTYISRARLTADAVNRGFRSVLQALAVEIGVVLVPWLYSIAQDDTIRLDADLAEHGVRIVAMAVAAFVMRRFLDPSAIPTPLPPANPGIPVDPAA